MGMVVKVYVLIHPYSTMIDLPGAHENYNVQHSIATDSTIPILNDCQNKLQFILESNFLSKVLS